MTSILIEAMAPPRASKEYASPGRLDAMTGLDGTVARQGSASPPRVRRPQHEDDPAAPLVSRGRDGRGRALGGGAPTRFAVSRPQSDPESERKSEPTSERHSGVAAPDQRLRRPRGGEDGGAEEGPLRGGEGEGRALLPRRDHHQGGGGLGA